MEFINSKVETKKFSSDLGNMRHLRSPYTMLHGTVAHNCHGKTKSHGTTNLTHGKTVLSDGKTKLIHGSTQLIHGKTKLTHGKTKLTHGKTKLTHGRTHLTHGKTKFTHGKTNKTSWSAVAVCVSNGMSCNSDTLIALGNRHF